MKIDRPGPEQLPGLRALWKAAFGDSEEFLDSFFTAAFSPDRCRCVTVGEDVAAALYWFDVSCRGEKMAYIYAVATAPACREQGLCRALMENTHDHLKASGYQGVMLVPEGDALSRMYRGLGYEYCTEIQDFVCAPGGIPAPMHRVDREEYARLRRLYLPAGGVVQEGENLAFLETQVRFYAGLRFLAAVRQEGDTILCPEILGDPGAAPGLLLALGAAGGTFRTPGRGKPFAMFLPLAERAEKPGYFGLAFD